MDEVLSVDPFEPVQHLDGYDENRLDGELSLAEFEKLLNIGSKYIHNKDVIVALNAEPVDVRYPDAALEDLVDFGFILKLRRRLREKFHFNGDFFPSLHIDPLEDVPERATS